MAITQVQVNSGIEPEFKRKGEKTYSIPASLGPSLQNTIQVFLSQQKRNASPRAKKILLQLLGQGAQLQKFLKNQMFPKK